MSQMKNIQVASPTKKSMNNTNSNSFINNNNNVISSFHQSPQKRQLQSSKNTSNRNVSLSQELIYQVLGQQQQFKKYKSKENLTRLIELYRKFVQFYSQKNDKIFIYFMDKISNLSTQVPSMTQSDQKLTMSMARQIQLQVQPSADKRFTNSKNVTITPAKYDPQMKRKQRSKNAQIAIQVSKIKKRANARTILNSYYQQCLENNVHVANDLQEQRKKLQEKLMAIHQKSMQNASKFTHIVSQSTQYRVLDDQEGNQIKGGQSQQSKSMNENSPIISQEQKSLNQSPVPMLQFSFNQRKGFK